MLVKVLQVRPAALVQQLVDGLDTHVRGPPIPEYRTQDDPDAYNIKHSALARRLVRGLGVTRKGLATKATLSTLRQVEAGSGGGRASRFRWVRLHPIRVCNILAAESQLAHACDHGTCQQERI